MIVETFMIRVDRMFTPLGYCGQHSDQGSLLEFADEGWQSIWIMIGSHTPAQCRCGLSTSNAKM